MKDSLILSIDKEEVPNKPNILVSGILWLADRIVKNVTGCVKDKNGEYHGITKRYMKSSLRNLIIGENLKLGELDGTVATISFMNAIILTIPYQLMGNISIEFLDTLHQIIKGCPNSSMLKQYNFQDIYNFYAVNMVFCIYSSIGVLCACFLYYFQR
jgi:hypothetical protein